MGAGHGAGRTGRDDDVYRPGDIFIAAGLYWLSITAYYAYFLHHFATDWVISLAKYITAPSDLRQAWGEVYVADFIQLTINMGSAIVETAICCIIGREFILFGMMLNDDYEQSTGVPNIA